MKVTIAERDIVAEGCFLPELRLQAARVLAVKNLIVAGRLAGGQCQPVDGADLSEEQIADMFPLLTEAGRACSQKQQRRALAIHAVNEALKEASLPFQWQWNICHGAELTLIR